MPKHSPDRWWDVSWNPVTGCDPISEGCAHCYAARQSKRFAGRFGYTKDDPFKVTFHPDRLDAPLHWRKPRRIFVCSMGDLFHEDVPFKTIAAVFVVMAGCPQHTFLVLTKRPRRALEFFDWVNMREYHGRSVFPDDGIEWRIWQILYVEAISNGACAWLKPHHGGPWPLPRGPWPLPNVYFGVTVETDKYLDRVEFLDQVPAAKRWLSIEPCLSHINLEPLLLQFRCCLCGFESIRKPTDLRCPSCGKDAMGNMIYSPVIDWCVLGGETGPGARPMDTAWARSVRDQCREADVPFWFKKMSGGEQPPEDLLIREFPE